VSLAVGPRQADGYHLIESLMLPLELHDDVTVAQGRPGSGMSMELSGPAAGSTPADAANLAWRAAELLAGESGKPADVAVTLVKRIPVGGGLGGGSADAAAALVGLNRLWGLNWPVERLAGLAIRLGSDVPFCVHSVPSWVRGRGEQVEPLANRLPPLWALLIQPGVAVSTRSVYERLDASRSEAGSQQSIIITRKHALAGLQLFNELEKPALEVCSRLGRLFQTLENTGVPRLMIAGSGSTLFAMFDNEAEPLTWVRRIKARVEVSVSVTAALALVTGTPDGTRVVCQGDNYGRQRGADQTGGPG
jgi:4-diphosphocytidyl-2-C-methyl-D-erythritol kinase